MTVKICSFCEESFSAKHGYDTLCKSCRLVKRILKKYLHMKLYFCANCKRPFALDISSRINRQYCSHECRKIAYKKTLRPRKAATQATPYRPMKVRFEVLKRDNFTCQYCGRTVTDGVKIVVDHVFPKALGGSDDMSNLVAACEDCNIGKGDRPLWPGETQRC